MEFFIDNIYTTIFMPLWAFVVILFGKYTRAIQSKKIIAGLTILSTLWSGIFILFAYVQTLKNPYFNYEHIVDFIRINGIGLQWGVYVDKLSATIALLVCVVSLLVQIYSYGYMKNDRSFPRFFAYLNFFNFAMIGLVLSATLFQMYIFWELVGVASYLLIGFWYKKHSASHAAKKAFIMNRIGDFGFLGGMIMIMYLMFEYSGEPMYLSVPFSQINEIAALVMSYTNNLGFLAICLMLVLAACAKSAQFPLHTWLADAMEGPTPVSALIHSATMVAAGVYLVARLYPLFVLSEVAMKVILVLGLITAILGAFIATCQTDIKRILAFSTNSQLGLMFMALGAGCIGGGIFHLTAHAFIKSMLFLCAGIVIHSVSNNQDIKFMGGLYKKMPVCATCFLVGIFALCGIMFAGFFSKSSIFGYFIDMQNAWLVGAFVLVAFLTGYYAFRAFFLIFTGTYRGSGEVVSTPRAIMNIPVTVLALIVATFGAHWVGNVSQIVIDISAPLLGALAAYLIFSTEYKPISVPILQNFAKNKLYFDEFYNYFFVKGYKKLAHLADIFDKYMIDGFVSLQKYLIRIFSWIFSKQQTGNFQSYLVYSMICITLIFVLMLFAYIVIFNWTEV